MIDAVRGLVRDVAAMPRLVHAGLGVAIVSFVADLAIHAAPAPHLHGAFRPEEHLAHLGGLVAMVLALAGIVTDGVRRRRPSKEEFHAHR